MRPLAKAAPLLLLLVGCGGSSSGGGAAALRPVLRIPNANRQVMDGFDTAGNPMVGTYDVGTRTLQVLGTGAPVSYVTDSPAGLQFVSGDYALLVQGGPTLDTLAFNLRTRATRSIPDAIAHFGDGNQVVLLTHGTFVLEDLDTGTQTPLNVPDHFEPIKLAGDKILLRESLGDDGSAYPSLRLHYAVLDAATGTIVNLQKPVGLNVLDVVGLNASGQVVGKELISLARSVDPPVMPVVWNAAGEATVLDTHKPVRVGGIADDGTVVITSFGGWGAVDKLKDGDKSQTRLRADGTQEATVSRNGQTIFLRGNSGTALLAYHLP